MSGYFLGLDKDNLIVERKKDENFDYENTSHLQNVRDFYGNSYFIYKATDFPLNEALNVVFHFVESNSEFFYNNKILLENIVLFFEKHQNIFYNDSFVTTDSILREGSLEELKKAFNSIMFYQNLSDINPRQRKVRNMMSKVLKSILTMSTRNEDVNSFNNYIVKTDNNENYILDHVQAEVFLESDLHFAFEIANL